MWMAWEHWYSTLHGWMAWRAPVQYVVAQWWMTFRAVIQCIGDVASMSAFVCKGKAFGAGCEQKGKCSVPDASNIVSAMCPPRGQKTKCCGANKMQNTFEALDCGTCSTPASRVQAKGKLLYAGCKMETALCRVQAKEN